MPALLLRFLLQCAGDIEFNPGPDSTPTPTNCVRLMKWNANGISGKMTDLLNFLHSSSDKITAIQETKLTNRTKPHRPPRWTAVRLDRHKNKGGGLQMLIKDTIQFVDNTAALPQSADPSMEQQGISIAMPNRPQLHIHNPYIPPISSCSDGYNASIAHLHSNKELSVVVGDINTHHSRLDWNTNEEERCEQLADELDAADYTSINENEASRFPTNGLSTSPDNSLASNDIALLLHWSVSSSLASHNSPILITIKSELSMNDRPRRTYINFMKPNWASYVDACDKYLEEAGETITVVQHEKTFKDAVN